MADSKSPPALVLGLSIHGLAVVRALATAGIEVHALESRANLPSVATRYARVHVREGVNTDGLARVLLSLRKELNGEVRPVLFPTSDTMVRSIASHWEELKEHYRVSWASHRATVLELQRKDGIAGYCERAAVLHPQTLIIESEDDELEQLEQLGFPLAVKPVRPLSGFKSFRVGSVQEVATIVRRYHADLPFVVQNWIDGPPLSLFFCTMYLHKGRVVSCFTGRKMRALPPETGMGTIMQSWHDADLEAAGKAFAQVLREFTGPLAVEFKQDDNGRFWLIEPNIGRTEYSVDLIIQSGINLPVIEYQSALQSDTFLPEPPPANNSTITWFDTEREPLCYLEAIREHRSLNPWESKKVFPYFGHDDPSPLVRASAQRLAWFVRGVSSKLMRAVRGNSGLAIERYSGLPELPDSVRQWFSQTGRESPFLGIKWFEIFETTVGRHLGTVEWFSFNGREDSILGVWPLIREPALGGDRLSFMANYYTPYARLAVERETDEAQLAGAIAAALQGGGRLTVAPAEADESIMSVSAWRLIRHGIVRLRDEYTVNWYQPMTSLDAYMSGIDGRVRNTLKRKQRALAKNHNVRLVMEDGSGDLDKAIGDYFVIYDKSWKKSEPYPEFIETLIRTAAAEKWLALGILYVDDKPAACQLWLVDQGVASIYKLAYDEDYARWSVGTQLTAWMIEWVMNNRTVEKLDYLTGNDAYKKDWMDCSRTLEQVVFVNLLRPRGLAYFVRFILSTIRNYAKTHARSFMAESTRDANAPGTS